MSGIREAADAKIEAYDAGEITDEVVETPAETPEVEEAPAEEVEETPAEEPTDDDDAAAAEAGQQAVDELAEDATEEEKEEARAAAEEEWFTSKYRTKDEAEAGIAEQDATIERLFKEREAMARQLRQIEEEKAAEPDELDLPAWEQWAAQAIEQGGGQQAAMLALQEGGYDGYEVLLRHWMSSDDPAERAQAVMFDREVVMSQAEVRAAAAVQRVNATPTPQQTSEAAYEMVKLRRPDVGDYADDMKKVVEGMAHEDRMFLKSLAESGLEGQAKAIEMTYLEAKAQRPSQAATAREAEKRRRRTSADAATLAATSPQAEGHSSRTPPPAAEQEGIDRKLGIRERMNLKIDDGLS